MLKNNIRILYIGESWLGSCARSVKESIIKQPEVILDEVNEDLFIPKPRSLILRLLTRIFFNSYQYELYKQILYRTETFKPDIILTYKGASISSNFIKTLQLKGHKVVTIYPDYSPHAYGKKHSAAIGTYDLVISTKPYHPILWKSVYGYINNCVFIPQGYDPALHFEKNYNDKKDFDIVLVATWRHEYGELMKSLARILENKRLTFAIGGNGWLNHRKDFPSNWTFTGELQGRSYVNFLRLGKICLAPLTRKVLINNVKQPGDEDTTRTYELAAANCFFIHRRTDYSTKLYNEITEVPMFDTPEELAEKILFYIDNPLQRKKMAQSAHNRAVQNYSLFNRSKDIIAELNELIDKKNLKKSNP